MGNTVQRWGTRADMAMVKRMLARDDTCWLCQHPGADSGDHVVPKSIAPHLMRDPNNLRPAHGVNGCPTCRVKCNQSRGNRMTMPGKREPEPSRWW